MNVLQRLHHSKRLYFKIEFYDLLLYMQFLGLSTSNNKVLDRKSKFDVISELGSKTLAEGEDFEPKK